MSHRTHSRTHPATQAQAQTQAQTQAQGIDDAATMSLTDFDTEKVKSGGEC